MLKWSEDYILNQPEIDHEHQSLFKLLNDFYQGLADGSSKEKLASLIKGLLDYAKVHFSNEEVYMKSINFPALEKHQQEHRAFITKASEFYEKYSSGKMLLSIEVTNFIKDWITNHIKTEDKQYARHAGL
ncbi:bacteriohemerythrin [Marinilabilia sp.]|uniref:bacteriohemerythrin n=1 Tax=Marinilabilia sp. TaxID=2021252 RepID=UPI0025B82CC6|nr:bacteriohemerythrin [Marinilabilia sp.]